MRNRAFLVLGFCLLCAGTVWGGRTHRLTENRLRELLPEAASIHPVALASYVRVNSTWWPREEAENYAALPLTVMVANSPQVWPPLGEWGFRCAQGLQPVDFARALGGGSLPNEGGEAPTLLRPEYIKSVTVEQEGDDAHGVVTFEAKGAYEGSVHYEAKYEDGAWAITAFAFPARDVRIVRREGAWKLDRMPFIPPPIQPAHVSSTDEPPPASERQAIVYLTFSGELVAGEESWWLAIRTPREQRDILDAFARWLQDRSAEAGHGADGARQLDLVLAIDGRTRWVYVSWIQQMCRSVGIRRVHLVARSMDTGKIGTVRTFLDRDSITDYVDELTPAISPDEAGHITVRLVNKHMPDFSSRPYVQIRIGPKPVFELPRGWEGREKETARRETYDHVFTAIRRLAAARVKEIRDGGLEPVAEIRAPLPFGASVPYEVVVQMIGALRGVGIARIHYEGSLLPLFWDVR